MSMQLESEVHQAIGRYSIGTLICTDDIIQYMIHPYRWTKNQIAHYLRMSKRVKRYGLDGNRHITYYEVIA